MLVDVDWQWARARQYELGLAKGERVIRQIGRGYDYVRPLGAQRERPLYLDFVELDGSPETCLAFARGWGLLTSPSPRDGTTESVSDWRTEIKNMKRLVNLVSMVTADGFRLATVPVTALTVHLAAGEPGHQPRLMMRPNTLISAMLLQFAQALEGGRSVRECPRCGKPFEIGGRGGKRSMAKFCSPQCQMAAHYRSRTQG
jgi:hypothetical protein